MSPEPINDGLVYSLLVPPSSTSSPRHDQYHAGVMRLFTKLLWAFVISCPQNDKMLRSALNSPPHWTDADGNYKAVGIGVGRSYD